MDEAKVPRKISNITAFFMITVALLLDLLQFLLTLLVLTSPIAELVTFLALCIFGVWFAIMRVNYFSGRKVGMKVASAFGSAVVELVPILDAVPGITLGVAGVIVATRIEERSQQSAAPSVVGKVRFGPQKLPNAANDNDSQLEEAA
jgi:hypothetical protein